MAGEVPDLRTYNNMGELERECVKKVLVANHMTFDLLYATVTASPDAEIPPGYVVLGVCFYYGESVWVTVEKGENTLASVHTPLDISPITFGGPIATPARVHVECPGDVKARVVLLDYNKLNDIMTSYLKVIEDVIRMARRGEGDGE